MNGLGALQNYVTGGQVTQAYKELLGRFPDAGGLQFYTNPNLSLADLKAQLAGSEEGRAFLAAQAPTGSATAMQASNTVAPGTMGAGVQPTTVADLYTRYLGREADPGGLASWTQQFGPTVDANELARFLGAASTKEEIASRASPVTTGTATTNTTNTTTGGGATTSGGVTAGGGTTTGGGGATTDVGTTAGGTTMIGGAITSGGGTTTGGGATGWGATGTTGDYSGYTGTAKARADVEAAFNQYLGRPPTENDIGYYTNQLLGGSKTLAQLQSDISGTPEAQGWYAAQNPTTTDTGGITTITPGTTTTTPGTTTTTTTPAKALDREQINEMYLKTLGRAGDPGGLDYYQGQGLTRDQLVNKFLSSQEYRMPTGIQGIAPRREVATLQGPTNFGTPAYMGGAPMTPVTAKDLGTQFVAPTDYAEVFTPETTYTTQDPMLTEAPASTETVEPLAGGGYIGENPAYSEYMAGQAEGGSVNMARGGKVPQSHGLRNAAQHLASKGRGEDSMLVHMTPDEVRGLRSLAHAQGHDLPINPHTGLPEAGWFGKLFKNIMKVVPFVLPFTGLGVLASAGLSGLAGATSGGGFNLKKGLMQGLMSYGVGSLAEAAKGANAAASAASTGSSAAQAAKSLVDPSQIGQGYGSIAKDYVAANTPELAVRGAGKAAEIGIDKTMQGGNLAATEAATQAAKEAAAKAAMGGVSSGYQAAAPAINAAAGQAAAEQIPGNVINKGLAAVSDFGTNVASSAKDMGTTAYNLATDPAARKTFTETMAKNAAEGPNLGLQNAMTATAVGASGLAAASAEEKYAKEAADIKAAEDEKNERMRRRVEEIMRSNPLPKDFSMAGGGMASYATGGNSPKNPRMLDGPGDGMSDSIPAVIGNKQPARLADGEFVIPADIVSHLGNGSSKAGSKQLYAMMDRIRKARTGRSSQAPEVRATKLMPA